MKKLLLCLVALFAAIGAQASTETIEKGFGTSGTSTVKFGATGKNDITAKADYKLTLNAENKLEVELTFQDLNNSDVEGLGNDPCYMFIDGVGNTQLSYADGKYTGTTTETATPGNFYSNCYFMRTCANTGANYGENGQLIFPFQFTAPKEGIYFDLKLGESTVTTNSYSFPYEIVVHPEDTDLTGATYKVRLQCDPNAPSYTDYTTQSGTIVQEGLTPNTTYKIYTIATINLNSVEYKITNNDAVGATVKTLEDANAIKFSIEAEQTVATSSSVTMHYKFTPTGDVPEGTTYRLWFDVDGVQNVEEYATTAEGDINIIGLAPEKTYNLYTKGYYTLPGKGEQQVTNFNTVFHATTTMAGEISAVVSDITKNTATLKLNCEPAEGKTVENIVVSGLGEGNDITLTYTDNLTTTISGLYPETTYNLTVTLNYTDASTATFATSFTTIAGVKPSITYTAFRGFTNVTDNSADLNVTVSLANPDNYHVEYWRLASARGANDTKLDGVEYEKWPYNDDLVWGDFRSTNGADGSYEVTIPLKNLPAGTTINNWMKSEIKISAADAYESGGYNNQTVTTLSLDAPVAEISDITATTATLTLTKVPEGATSVVISGLGEGNDITVDLESKTAELTGLTPETPYNLTLTASFEDNKTSQSTVSFTTLTAPKEVSMEFIPVNVSDLSALFKLKVQLIDNATSKESIYMYLRKANETPEATADDPYAIYGEAKGTPALDPREGIENPIYFNYTELEKGTEYIATAVVKKDGYYGVAEKRFTTLDEANSTSTYIVNGYFQDGAETTSDSGETLKMVYLAAVRYTFTYDTEAKVLYLTFDTRIRNNPTLPDLVSKYLLHISETQEGDKADYDGYPVGNTAGFKDHYSFVINNRCPNIGYYVENNIPMTFTYYTDYRAGGQSHIDSVVYDGTTKSDDFGEPVDIQWIEYSYEEQHSQNKNRYDLYKLVPKTQLMATVLDADGHYLPRRLVEFEMAEGHEDHAKVSTEYFAEQPKWFVEANSLEGTDKTEVYFNVVAFHQLETEAAPAGAPRRAVSADGKRLEATKQFYYIESNTPTGIDDIEADDANAPVRYFDLNGREISEPQKGMFVIRLQGSKATKMIAE